MNGSKLTVSEFSNAGSDLWIVQNNPSLDWWQELDLRTCFLLTRASRRSSPPTPTEFLDILKATGLDKTASPTRPDANLLLGTENFFPNRWLLLIESGTTADEILAQAQKLGAKSLRFFSDFELCTEISTRPTASSLNISFIENI
jgi:hypothetical protein